MEGWRPIPRPPRARSGDRQAGRHPQPPAGRRRHRAPSPAPALRDLRCHYGQGYQFQAAPDEGSIADVHPYVVVTLLAAAWVGLLGRLPALPRQVGRAALGRLWRPPLVVALARHGQGRGGYTARCSGTLSAGGQPAVQRLPRPSPRPRRRTGRQAAGGALVPRQGVHRLGRPRRGVAEIAGITTGRRLAHALKDAIEWEYRQFVKHLRG